MTIGQDERMECLNPRESASNQRFDSLKKDNCNYDSFIGRGFVNRIDNTCIIEFESLQDLEMYDRVSSKLGHICHGAFDEPEKPLLGFSDDDIQESITYIEQYSRFQNSLHNPTVSLKRLPEKYLLGTRMPSNMWKGLLKDDEKSRRLNSLKRRRSERTPKCPARLIAADSCESHSHLDGSSSEQPNSRSKAASLVKSVYVTDKPECQDKLDSKLISIGPHHIVCRRIAADVEECGDEFVDVANCESSPDISKNAGSTNHNFNHEPVDSKESLQNKPDRHLLKQIKLRHHCYELPSVASKCSSIHLPSLSEDETKLAKVKIEPNCRQSHEQPSHILGNWPALKPEPNGDSSDAGTVELVSAFLPSFKTPSPFPMPVDELDPLGNQLKTNNAKDYPQIASSIPYIVKCCQQSSFRKCEIISSCANANTKFGMYFVLTVGRGRKLSQCVVESFRNEDPCKISKACAYIAASAVGNHPTTILAPANERVVEKILSANQSNFLKEKVEETREIERRKWLPGSSSLHVSIAQDKTEIIAEKVIAARQKEFIKTQKFTTVHRDIGKGILLSDKCCDSGSGAVANRSASITLNNAITGDEEEPPHKKCLIDAASGGCNSSGKIAHRSVASISPPEENVRTKMSNASSIQSIIVPLLSASPLTFQQENKTIDRSSIPANDIPDPESPSEGKALAFKEPAAVSLVENPANVGSGYGPKSIPVIIHPKYLQKLKLKANGDTSIKSAHSVAPKTTSPQGNLGKFSDREHLTESVEPPFHSDVADDPDVIFVPTESVTIDLTKSDDDDYIDLIPEKSKHLPTKCENPQSKHHENSTKPTLGAREYSETIVTLPPPDDVPKLGVICTTFPELGFVRVDKKANKLRLYDQAIVSIPLDFTSIQELKRFLNSRLVNFSYPDINIIELEWILVTAGFLRVKTVPCTNPQFWQKLIIPKQTRKDMRNIAKTGNGPQTKKAVIVPIPQNAPVHKPQPPNCKEVNNILPVLRLATDQGASVSLAKNCKLIHGSDVLPSASGGQRFVLDSSAVVGKHKKGSESILAKSCDTVTEIHTTASTGPATIASSHLSETSAVISTPTVLKTSLLLAQTGTILTPASSMDLTLGSPSSLSTPVKTVLMTTVPVLSNIKPSANSRILPSKSSSVKCSVATVPGPIPLKTMGTARSLATGQISEVLVPAASIATPVVPTALASSSPRIPSVGTLCSSPIPSGAMLVSRSVIQRIGSGISPSGNSRLTPLRQQRLILPKGCRASFPVFTSTLHPLKPKNTEK